MTELKTLKSIAITHRRRRQIINNSIMKILQIAIAKNSFATSITKSMKRKILRNGQNCKHNEKPYLRVLI